MESGVPCLIGIHSETFIAIEVVYSPKIGLDAPAEKSGLRRTGNNLQLSSASPVVAANAFFRLPD